MKKIYVLVLLAAVVFYASSSASKEKVEMNDIQVIGSHNSYKMAIEVPLWNMIYQQDSAQATSLQYSHISLVEQLNMGLRSVELDVFYDPKGGHFSNPKGLVELEKMGIVPETYDTAQDLSKPGLKMFHVQDIDFRSDHLLFREGLQVMKKWSETHPNHMPIFVMINAKDKTIDGLRVPLQFTKEALSSIDEEIKSVFSNEQLLIPDAVRGKHKSLEKAILKKGWPSLEASKGRFLFVLDEKPEKIDRYLEGHPSLSGRVMFVNSEEGNPEAAFRIVNNPIRDFEYIQQLVNKGYMVRTRSDAGTKEARTKDYSRFQQAVKSGAQVISTDYYIPSTLFESDFKVSFSDGSFERIK